MNPCPWGPENRQAQEAFAKCLEGDQGSLILDAANGWVEIDGIPARKAGVTVAVRYNPNQWCVSTSSVCTFVAESLDVSGTDPERATNDLLESLWKAINPLYISVIVCFPLVGGATHTIERSKTEA